MKIRWRIAYISGGWFKNFGLHGEIEVPDTYTAVGIRRAVNKVILKSFKITWEKMD